MVATFLLILAGALVTSRDAGLAVPDWPLSFGTLNPPNWYAIENVRTEHGHRVIAGCVALVTVLLGFCVRKRERDPVVRRLAALAVATVLLQALLGGLRVLQLSVDLAMVHACLGQVFLCIVVAIAALTSPHWRARTASASITGEPAGARLLAALVPATVLLQLVIGVMIRHGGPESRPLLGSAVFLAHGGLALVITTIAVRLRVTLHAGARRSDAVTHATRRAGLLVALIAAQLLVGLAAFLVTETVARDRQATVLESWVPTLHVGLGAAILATSIVVALHVAVRRSAHRLEHAHGADVVTAGAVEVG